MLFLLAIGLIWSLVYVLRLKKDIRRIRGSLGKIKEMDTNMRLTTSTFDKDVTDLAREVNDVLENQAIILLESERVNREFRQGITNISHDLRTPLTSASGYVGLIKSGKISDEKKLEYLDVVEGRLNALARLMEELFDYVQIIEGNIKLELTTVSLSSLVREELVSFYDALKQGGFEVVADIPEKEVQLIADSVHLRRIVQNLMGNVVKHGIDYFEIKISPAGVLTFINQVTDAKGIEVDRMFERFYTSDASRASQKTGLGLAITRALVEQMGGKIHGWLEGDRMYVEVKMRLFCS